MINISDNISQSNNVVYNGDIVGGDKIVMIKKDMPQARAGIRESLGFEPECDSKNTTLKRKLRDGRLNKNFIDDAVEKKLQTISLLLKFRKSEEGKKVIADVYANLMTILFAKYISAMEDNDLLKTKMGQIVEEFSLLVHKYNSLINIDEAFLYGLLFVATSNCALKWKVEDAV